MGQKTRGVILVDFIIYYTYNDYMKELSDYRQRHAQEVEEGKWCCKCNAFLLFSHGFPERCADCQKIDKPDELRHDHFVRCPKCKSTWQPYEHEEYEVFEEGQHEICCQECDHSFEVETWIQYTFTSPPIIDQE